MVENFEGTGSRAEVATDASSCKLDERHVWQAVAQRSRHADNGDVELGNVCDVCGRPVTVGQRTLQLFVGHVADVTPPGLQSLYPVTGRIEANHFEAHF